MNRPVGRGSLLELFCTSRPDRVQREEAEYEMPARSPASSITYKVALAGFVSDTQGESDLTDT